MAVGSAAHLDALLWIQREVDNHSVIVRAAGEVNSVTAPSLDAQLRLAEAIVVPPAPTVLDLRDITFMGSAGVTVLLEHHRRCADLGSRLQVLGNSTVTRPIVVAGLAGTLAVVLEARMSRGRQDNEDENVTEAHLLGC